MMAPSNAARRDGRSRSHLRRLAWDLVGRTTRGLEDAIAVTSAVVDRRNAVLARVFGKALACFYGRDGEPGVM